MTPQDAGKVRVSFSDDPEQGRTVLITALTHRPQHLTQRLVAMGLLARSFGQLLVVTGAIEPQSDGTFADFTPACSHRSLADATSHAKERFGTVFREFGIKPEYV